MKNSKMSIALISLTVLFGISVGKTTYAVSYTVEQGDTMTQIADNHDVSLETLLDENPQITNPNVIYPNQGIKIPSQKSNDAAYEDENNYEGYSSSNDKNNIYTPFSASQNEVFLLGELIEAEAKGESFEGKVAVAQVVMNRVESNQYPNDIRSVIYQNGQFVPVMNGLLNGATSDSLKASRQAIQQGGNANGALFFYNSEESSSSWLDSRKFIEQIGKHKFMR